MVRGVPLGMKESEPPPPGMAEPAYHLDPEISHLLCDLEECPGDLLQRWGVNGGSSSPAMQCSGASWALDS